MRLAAAFSLLFLLLGLSAFAYLKDTSETAFQITCGDTVTIVTPATGPNLDLAERMTKCVELDKSTCTIETVKLTRKSLK